MKSNVKIPSPQPLTHEGARADRISAEAQLMRSVMSCMLWEDTFYESGETVAKRIERLVPLCRPEYVAACAFRARSQMKLRHVPLLLVAHMTFHPEHKKLVARLLPDVIQRADELSEFLAIYFKIGSKKISAQVKRGLAKALLKFDEYALAKNDHDSAEWKLRDVLFLSHSNPCEPGSPRFTRTERKAEKLGEVKYPRALNSQEALYKRLAEKTLASPETWENRLSRGENKREVFEDLMQKGELGAMAFLRNLRGMTDAGVPRGIIAEYAGQVKTERVLPFRFISAARAAPQYEPILEPLMLRCMTAQEKFEGPTALLVDHSGSMNNLVSAKSQITRFDAATALGILLREVCSDGLRVFTFSDFCIEVPARRGFALHEAIKSRINPVSTHLGSAVRHIYKHFAECERIIVITDEQSTDRPPAPQGRGYIVNVAPYQNGIGYGGGWVHIDGWSEAIVGFIRETEKPVEAVVTSAEQ